MVDHVTTVDQHVAEIKYFSRLRLPLLSFSQCISGFKEGFIRDYILIQDWIIFYMYKIKNFYKQDS